MKAALLFVACSVVLLLSSIDPSHARGCRYGCWEQDGQQVCGCDPRPDGYPPPPPPR